MSMAMFDEYDTAGIIYKSGLRPNGTGWQRFVEDHQFTAINQGPAFSKIVMKGFAMTETNARQLRQMPGDSEKYHPLSATPKGRYFEHCVANERDKCPRWMEINKRGGNDETYQYFADTGGSLICQNCNFGDVSEDTYSGIASEIVKKRLRDKVATRAPASSVQLVRDSFSSGTPAPAHRIGQAGGVAQNLFGGGFARPWQPRLTTADDPLRPHTAASRRLRGPGADGDQDIEGRKCQMGVECTLHQEL
jgi:hypothetical protein